jgi:tetratricopeptide (TPR) repeat protein
MELHTKLGVLLRELGFIKRSAKVLGSGRLNAEEDCVLETQAGVQLFVEFGMTLRMQGCAIQAQETFLEARRTEEGMILVRDIGWTKFCMGDYEGALPHLEEAAAISKQAGVAEFPQGPDTLSALATVTHSLGNLGAAIQIHGSGVEILREIDALQSPTGGKQLNELATAKRLSGDIDGSQQANAECLRILNAAGTYAMHKGAEAERELAGILAAKSEMQQAAAAYSRQPIPRNPAHDRPVYETTGGLKLLVERAQYEWDQKAYKCSMETFEEALRIHAKIAGKEWVSPRKALIVECIVQLRAAQDASLKMCL